MLIDVVLYLPIHRGESLGWSGGSDLWTRTMRTGFLPAPADPGRRTQDRMMLWPGEEGPDEGVMWEVQRRYWRTDGTAVLELVDMHLDPGKAMQRHCDGFFRRAWWVSRDGDPEPRLQAAGWVKA